MKTKFAKRVLSSMLTLGMLVSLLPATSWAVTEVTPNPSQDSNTKLNVEYFSSTLYDWDEEKANEATKTADTGKKITSSSSLEEATLWTITKVDDNCYTISADGKYLTWSGQNTADAVGANNVTKLTVTDCDNTQRDNTVTIGLYESDAKYKYLNYHSSSSAFGGWSSNGASDDGSAFYITTDGNTQAEWIPPV